MDFINTVHNENTNHQSDITPIHFRPNIFALNYFTVTNKLLFTNSVT